MHKRKAEKESKAFISKLEEAKEFEFRHLLDVVVGNRSFIFNLDE